MKNLDIRAKVKEKGLRLWQVAYELGYDDFSFSRKLRKELSVEEKAKIFEIIDKLSNEFNG